MSEIERASARPAQPQRRLPTSSMPPWVRWILRSIAALLGLAAGLAFAGALLVAIALSVAYPNLPEISGLNDYRPKLPMRVYSADNVLLGEFGEERRSFLPISKTPKVMQDAVLAIEDARFYQHPGVDYIGVIRAGLANFGESQRSQGASTITMQVARNFYLSSEKTFTRKIYEILLALKIESQLTKEQILEVYMNQIYLGPARTRFRRCKRDLLRKAAQGHHGGGGGDARWSAEGAVRIQPDRQSGTGDTAAALHHRPDARERLHHAGAARRGTRSAAEVPQPGRSTRACRVRGRGCTAARVQPVRRGGLRARAQRLPEHQRDGPDGRVSGAAQGHHGLRTAPGLPRARGLRRSAGQPEGPRCAHRRSACRASRQRRAQGSRRAGGEPEKGGGRACRAANRSP